MGCGRPLPLIGLRKKFYQIHFTSVHIKLEGVRRCIPPKKFPHVKIGHPSRQSLYSMRNGTGSQWRTSRRIGVMRSYFLLLQMSLAAALSTDWSPSRRHAGAPASRLLQRSTREVTKAATAAFAAPRDSDLMQLLMRRSWRKQQPTVHATWCLMDRSDSSRTLRSA